jgi:hypothetical protein
MSAVGAALGTLTIIALLGFVFHQLGGISLFSPLVQKLQDVIDQSTQKAVVQQATTDVSPTSSVTPAR